MTAVADHDLHTGGVGGFDANEPARRVVRDRGFADSPLEGDGFELPVPREKASFASVWGCPSVIEKGSSSPGPATGLVYFSRGGARRRPPVSIGAIIAFAATTEFASDRVARLPDELLECGDRLRVGYQTQNRAVAV